jgi:hypothetical protein
VVFETEFIVTGWEARVLVNTEAEGMAKSRAKGTRRGSAVASSELVAWALGGLEREITATRERLASLTATAARLRGRGRVRSVVSNVDHRGRVAGGGRGRMTAEGRRRISDMMKKRWAEAKRKKLNRLV